MAATTPYIPEFITVHLGAPDSNAPNVTVPFPEYIKNVASSEIYPTWSDNTINANILAQISFALNRVYLEYYRTRGYNFNITNDTRYDQSYVHGRNIFDNIDHIVNDLFDDYIRRVGYVEPLSATYCNGTTTKCDGMSQWGSEDLGNQGKESMDILRYYYGNDVELVENAPIQPEMESYPGKPIRKGDNGRDVRVIQTRLNRVSQNFPLIPKVNPVDGVFGTNTENAVKKFQEISNLTVDGIVGKNTWYKLLYTYSAVKKLNDLQSEGQKYIGLSLEYTGNLAEGATGYKVNVLQYFLAVISQFYETIPFVEITGFFGPVTKESVIAFQKEVNLPQTGVVDEATWNQLYEIFAGIRNLIYNEYSQRILTTIPYPGVDLKEGMQGDSVRILQEYLNLISISYNAVSAVPITGSFDNDTTKAVTAFQKQFGLDATGIVNEVTWNKIADVYKDVLSAATTSPTQYPGYVLSAGKKDNK